jgi:elongation factor 2
MLILGPGMIIPAARRLYKGTQLCSDPRLMEPIFLCEITTSREGLNGIRSVLTKRRGKILEENSINGTPLHLIKVFILFSKKISYSLVIIINFSNKKRRIYLFQNPSDLIRL